MKRICFVVFVFILGMPFNRLLAESENIKCGMSATYDEIDEKCYCDSGYKVSEDGINCILKETTNIDTKAEERTNIYSFLSDKQRITVVDEYSNGWQLSLDKTCSMNIVGLIAYDPVHRGAIAKGIRIEFEGKQFVNSTQLVLASLISANEWRRARNRGYYIKDADDVQKETFDSWTTPQGQYGSNTVLLDYDEVGFLTETIKALNSMIELKDNKNRHVYYTTKGGFIIGFYQSGNEYDIYAKNLSSDLLFKMDKNYLAKLKGILDTTNEFLGAKDLKRYKNIKNQ